MSKDKIDEIRERWAKATPGPWKADAKQNVGENWLVGAILDCGGTDIDGAWANWIVTTDNLRASECTSGSAREDAEAIAAAPEDIQTLLAEIDRLRGIEEELDGVFTARNSSSTLEFREYMERLEEAFYGQGTQIGELRSQRHD